MVTLALHMEIRIATPIALTTVVDTVDTAVVPPAFRPLWGDCMRLVITVAMEVAMVATGIISTTRSTGAGAEAEEKVLVTVLTLIDRTQIPTRQCCTKVRRCDLNSFLVDWVDWVGFVFSSIITIRSGNEP